MFCIPGPSELDNRRAAESCGAEAVKLVGAGELPALTGYQRGGCSPLGMTRSYPIFIDLSAQRFERIVVSGGRIEIQVDVEAGALADIAGARFADLTSR